MHACCFVYCPADAEDGGSSNSSAQQMQVAQRVCQAYLQHVSLFRRKGPGVHGCWSSATVAQEKTLLHPLLMPSRALQVVWVRAVVAGPVSSGTSWGCTWDSSRPVCGAQLHHAALGWTPPGSAATVRLLLRRARGGVVLLLLLSAAVESRLGVAALLVKRLEGSQRQEDRWRKQQLRERATKRPLC